MGAFCVAIFGAQELADSYREKDDDYNAIMAQALADRFAEAFAEYLHKQVRTKHWGYASDEKLTNEDLIKESYKGFVRHRVILLVQIIWKRKPFGTCWMLKNKLVLH